MKSVCGPDTDDGSGSGSKVVTFGMCSEGKADALLMAWMGWWEEPEDVTVINRDEEGGGRVGLEEKVVSLLHCFKI